MRTVGARLAAPEDYAVKLLVNPRWHETDLTIAKMIRGMEEAPWDFLALQHKYINNQIIQLNALHAYMGSIQRFSTSCLHSCLFLRKKRRIPAIKSHRRTKGSRHRNASRASFRGQVAWRWYRNAVITLTWAFFGAGLGRA